MPAAPVLGVNCGATLKATSLAFAATPHILRHTFCSHLAMRGAPALSIQRLAGHEDMQTTLGYMHLAQGETERAIRLLDSPPVGDEPGSVASNGLRPATWTPAAGEVDRLRRMTVNRLRRMA